MLTLKRVARALNVLLIASLLLVPGLRYPGPADAAVASPDVSPTPDPLTSVLGPAFDMMVSQAVGALGWQVVSTDSQLDPSSITGAGPQMAGDGRWQVAALDDRLQAATLAGSLRYEVAVDQPQPTEANVTTHLRGALSGGDTDLGLDLVTQAAQLQAAPQLTMTMALRLTRAGQVSDVSVKTATSTRSVGYGMTQMTTRATVERDGKATESTQTVTARDLGRGEGEVWVRTANIGTPGGRTVQQHAFRHATAGGIEEYLDRFDLTQFGKTYALAAPVTLIAQPGRAAGYDFTLVGPAGKSIRLKSATLGTARAPAPMIGHPGLAPVSWSPGSTRVDRVPLWEAFGPTPAPDRTHWAGGWWGSLSTGEKVAVGVVVAAGAVAVVAATGGLALAGAAEAAAAAAEAGAYEAALASAAEGAAWESAAIGGGSYAEAAAASAATDAAVAGSRAAAASIPGLISGANALADVATAAAFGGAGFGGAFAGANADPYFVVPNNRRKIGEPAPAPVQITRITGGLVAPETALTVTVPASGTAPIAASGAASYNDRPGAFVSGSLPPGAREMGDWSYDPARTFGAAVSHTQHAPHGAQLHYFIHASTPLTLTADDNLIQYVYLDPQTLPAEFLLQFYVGGDGEHRAYWGADRIQSGGQAGSPALYPMGPLPPAGTWVRLQIPASALGLAGHAVDGALYGSFDGPIWWGPTTTSSRLTDNAPAVLPVTDPLTLPVMQPGAQIAVRTAKPLRLTADIVDGNGSPVRTLLKESEVQPGYQVLAWDAKDDAGAAVKDVPYRVRLTSGGQTLAESGVTISPLGAHLRVPGRFSLVRGHDVPVIGEAYGDHFNHYVLDYGAGLQPSAWVTITTNTYPVLAPTGNETLKLFNPGNLANWNVGLDEFAPWKEAGLNGVYTLRLRVFGQDGRETEDSVPVVIGRLAHTPIGGTIASPDARARLIVPSFATTQPYQLLAVVPAAQLDPDGVWQASLPADKKLAGEVYELMPSGAAFRRPAVLELPYATGSDPARLGILLGDGTPDGWRYIGGKPDAARGVIAAPLLGLTGARVLAAPFLADSFGAAPVLPDGRPAQVAPAAPVVKSKAALLAFDTDLSAGPDDWAAWDVNGTDLARVTGADAGLPDGVTAIRVTRVGDGQRLVRLPSAPYDVANYPILSFDYRAPDDYAPHVMFHINGTWWQALTGNAGAASPASSAHYFDILPVPRLERDDKWHHYQVDLLAYLREADPTATQFKVDEIVLGQVNTVKYLQYAIIDGGAAGSAYYIRNLAALAPSAQPKLEFTLTAPRGVAFKAYQFAFDQAADTAPVQSTPATLSVTLPQGAPDGTWYLHARGQAADGQWSVTAHFPLLVDRTAPEAGRPDPPPGGAGAPDSIRLPLADATSGLDLSTLRVALNGTELKSGPALAYQPATGSLTLTPNLVPGAKPINTGRPVTVTLLAASDYAGNRVAKPFSWTFTADRPVATGDVFRRLTVGGGVSPAVSPDGVSVAFVSSRDGSPRVYVMSADDYEEKAKSAKALTSGPAVEADPAWSPDGKLVAFVSSSGGAPQIWTAAPDGSAAHALTQIDGALASPTWSPDGKSIAFIRDGNLWTVDTGGAALRALTTYVDRPLRAASWQPGGSLIAVDFKLYQETIELYDTATGDLTPLTQGGQDTFPAWLNRSTLLYSAPADRGQPSAVWQVNTDGSGQSIIPDSGRPGAGDMQPSAAADGGALAIASTRGGGQDIWLRATLQIARFDVEPAEGVPAGEPLHIAYALPAEADVTLEVLGPSDTPARRLVDAAHQVKGAQTLDWDGTGTDGKPLVAGDYRLKLTAQVGSGEPLVRFATARLLDARNIGNLQVAVNQWSDTPVVAQSDLHVRVFPTGQRVRPVGQSESAAQSTFKLPDDRYDVLVDYGALQRVATGVKVEGGKSVTQTIDLGLGTLEVTVQYAPGQTAQNGVLRIIPAADPNREPVVIQSTLAGSFVLAPGRYDVLADVDTYRQSEYGVEVKTGQVTHQDLTLGLGVLRVTVLASAGQPATPRNFLGVVVFPAGDHQHSLQGLYGNPAETRLPPGRYDLQATYLAGNSSNASGILQVWDNDVAIQSGETTEREVNLHVGEVALTVFQSAGQPMDTSNLAVRIYPSGILTQAVATLLYTNTATLQLSTGKYDVVGDVLATRLMQRGSLATFEVREGETTRADVDFKLARLRVEVDGPDGKPLDPDTVYGSASLVTKPDEQFSFAPRKNPLELWVVANEKYDVAIMVNNRPVTTLTGQSAAEGETLELKVTVPPAS